MSAEGSTASGRGRRRDEPPRRCGAGKRVESSRSSGVAPTPPSARRAEFTMPPSRSTTHATETSAKSPGRRANSSKAVPTSAAVDGKKTQDVSSSSGSAAVIRKPSKKSSAATVRSPLGCAGRPSRPEQPTRRELGRRIGVGDRPADRAAVADRRMADVGNRFRQQWTLRRDLAIALQVRLGRHSADSEGSVVDLVMAKLVERIDVHHTIRPGQAHVHQRDQALPASENLDLIAARGQRFQGLVREFARS